MSRRVEKVGRHIKASETAYEQAWRSLTEGRGNLVRKAEQIKQLGATTSKELDTSLRTAADNSSQETDDT